MKLPFSLSLIVMFLTQTYLTGGSSGDALASSDSEYCPTPPSVASNLEFVGQDIFGDLSIDVGLSFEHLNDLASRDPLHALYTLGFARGPWASSTQLKYGKGVVPVAVSRGFYEAALFNLMSGNSEEELGDSSTAFTTPLEDGVILVEHRLVKGVNGHVELRIRTSKATSRVIPEKAIDSTIAKKSLGGDVEFNITETLLESVVSLKKIDGTQSDYVITSVSGT